MAIRSKRPCMYPGCSELTNEKYCDKHKQVEQQQKLEQNRIYDKTVRNQRDVKYKDFYHSKEWLNARNMALIRDNGLCQCCLKNNRVRKADLVHHIIEIKVDLDKRLVLNNLLSLCNSCHNKIHDGVETMRKIVIIYGPPGSGKTTYALKNKKKEDIVVDIDMLYQALTGLQFYDRPQSILKFILKVREDILNRIYETDVNAYIVGGFPRKEERDKVIKRFEAESIFLNVSKEECVERVKKDPRRSDNVDYWQTIIEKWWQEYQE